MAPLKMGCHTSDKLGPQSHKANPLSREIHGKNIQKHRGERTSLTFRTQRPWALVNCFHIYAKKPSTEYTTHFHASWSLPKPLLLPNVSPKPAVLWSSFACSQRTNGVEQKYNSKEELSGAVKAVGLECKNIPNGTQWFCLSEKNIGFLAFHVKKVPCTMKGSFWGAILGMSHSNNNRIIF